MTTSAISPPPLNRTTKVLYAFGAVANVIKQRGLATFLLLFYNQVVGLPPQMVSTAIMITLVFDAIIDPAIGQISDNLRSPLGRRHPFMYVAALPVAMAFFLIWNPPNWEHGPLFAYLLICLLAIRLFDTFFELPSNALLAELTKDYDERTGIISLRSIFGVIGGLGMTLLAYRVFLRENLDGSGGVLAREGYVSYSITAALLIFTAIVVSTVATHHRIRYLSAPPSRKITLSGMAKEVAATLNNRSFVAMTLSGIFLAVSIGIKEALELYLNLYYWELPQVQLASLTMAGIIAAVVGVIIIPRLSNWLGKRTAGIIVLTTASIALVAPVVLRLLGVMPANGAPTLFPTLLTFYMVNQAAAIMTVVMISSMIADIVEDAEVKTGRRSEGLLMAADNLFRKIVSGLGVFVSGTMLAVVHFPRDAQRGQVPHEVLNHLALLYVPTTLFFFGLAIACMFLYAIDREKHEANLSALAERLDAAPLNEI